MNRWIFHLTEGSVVSEVIDPDEDERLHTSIENFNIESDRMLLVKGLKNEVYVNLDYTKAVEIEEDAQPMRQADEKACELPRPCC